MLRHLEGWCRLNRPWDHVGTQSLLLGIVIKSSLAKVRERAYVENIDMFLFREESKLPLCGMSLQGDYSHRRCEWREEKRRTNAPCKTDLSIALVHFAFMCLHSLDRISRYRSRQVDLELCSATTRLPQAHIDPMSRTYPSTMILKHTVSDDIYQSKKRTNVGIRNSTAKNAKLDA
jgi:hypothetical protein